LAVPTPQGCPMHPFWSSDNAHDLYSIPYQIWPACHFGEVSSNDIQLGSKLRIPAHASLHDSRTAPSFFCPAAVSPCHMIWLVARLCRHSLILMVRTLHLSDRHRRLISLRTCGLLLLLRPFADRRCDGLQNQHAAAAPMQPPSQYANEFDRRQLLRSCLPSRNLSCSDNRACLSTGCPAHTLTEAGCR